MLQQYQYCPLCHSGPFHDYITCKDHMVSKEMFTISKCDNCSFLFTNPKPDNATLPDYYQSDNYISHKNKSTNPINILYKLARSFTIKSKVKLINKYSQRGRILDVGCGTGHFLKACSADAWNCTGVEPDETARTTASTKTEGNIYKTLDEVPDEKYDMITLWHVLEHVTDLHPYVNKLYNLMEENGHLLIAVPNHKSYDAANYKEYWAAWDVPRHLYHFDQETMTKLVAEHELQIMEVIPMKLDSYYVSMLSETYKGKGIAKYVNSIINGYKSNSYGRKNNLNYSSIIYIIKRK